MLATETAEYANLRACHSREPLLQSGIPDVAENSYGVNASERLLAVSAQALSAAEKGDSMVDGDESPPPPPPPDDSDEG